MDVCEEQSLILSNRLSRLNAVTGILCLCVFIVAIYE